jgi:hypothetical protein
MLVDNLYNTWTNDNINDFWVNNNLTDCSSICKIKSITLKHRISSTNLANYNNINTRTSININKINNNINKINIDNKNYNNINKKLNNNNNRNKTANNYGTYSKGKLTKRNS